MPALVSPGLVSVIVVNWNRRELLRQCLLSLLGQRNATLEIIVVDNGSSDGSVEMVSLEFPAVIVIRNSQNRGFCAANNQGIARASGEFVALLNNDAEADPLWAHSLQRIFQGSPGTSGGRYRDP